MAQALDLPAPQLSALATLRDLGEAGIARLAEVIEEQKVLLSTEEMRRAVKRVCQDRVGAVGDLLTSVSLLRQLGSTPQEILDDLAETIAQLEEPCWTAEELQGWEELRDPLERLFSGESFTSLGEAIHLKYSRENVLRDVEVVTAVRPVFDSSAEHTLGAVISHTLHIRYHVEMRMESLSLVLDQKDLERLIEASRKAMKKSLALKEQLKQTFPRITLAGQEDADE